MEFHGEFDVKANKRDVISFITDLDRIISIIPEVLSAEKVGNDSIQLVVKAGQSAIKGKFKLLLVVKNVETGGSVEISARGSGTTGSLDLRATYDFSDFGEGSTMVKWAVNLTIGGMIKTMGARVINKTADNYVKILTDSFKKGIENAQK